MKKLIAAALTGALVLGTVGTSVVFAADDDKTITVAASETPHSEILEAAKPILEEEGYDLEVTVFDDYVQPNEVVESGDFDANYFQHIPYLNSFNRGKRNSPCKMQVVSIMNHLEFILEQNPALMISQMATQSQYRTIPQTRQEHFFFSRTTELSN